MALTEVMKMKSSDLEFLVEQHNGALGSTGTGSGTNGGGGQVCCDGTIVHCCFKDIEFIKVQEADPDESPSGYKLVAGDCEFAIGLEEED
ncbi:MAG: hypothetical protein ACOC22_03590 [bacterium]